MVEHRGVVQLPSPVGPAELLASHLPEPLAAELAHVSVVRRALACRPDLSVELWRAVADTSGGDVALRAQLVWHRHAAGHLEQFLRHDDDPVVLVAAAVAHSDEAAEVLATFEELPLAVLQVIAALAGERHRWAIADRLPFAAALVLALQASTTRDDESIAALVTVTAATPGRSPEPPPTLLDLCVRRPGVATMLAFGADRWLACAAAASGMVDLAAISPSQLDTVDPAVARILALHPCTPPPVAGQLAARLVCPLAPPPVSVGVGHRPDELDDAARDELVAFLRDRAPQEPWCALAVRTLEQATLARQPLLQYQGLAQVAPLTTVLGPRFSHVVSGSNPEAPTGQAVDAATTAAAMPVASLREDAVCATATAWLVEQLGCDPASWEVLLALASSFRGTLAHLAAVTPALR